MSALADLLEAPARQAGAVAHVDHRPWPLPERPWVNAQTWEQLLFAHWRVDAAELRPFLPAGLELERFAGDAWLGIVPFRVSALRLRGFPPLPIVSTALEVNVRTYVTYGGKPGVWFLSLDASSPLLVEAGSRGYSLGYRHARGRLEERDGWSAFELTRVAEPERRFRGRYRGAGKFLRAEPRSLEHFLTERYCLYASDREGRILRAEIHHEPWSLQQASLELEEQTLVPAELELRGEPVCHLGARQDVVVWAPERV